MSLLGLGLILVVVLLVLGPKQMQTLLYYLGKLMRKAMALRAELDRSMYSEKATKKNHVKEDHE